VTSLVELYLLVALPIAVSGAIGIFAGRRERRRRALRRCPACHGRALIRALLRPPRDQPRYRRAAIAFRCTSCDLDLFELIKGRPAGPLTGDQLDQLVPAGELPVARLHRR
jgi:hypothetical protein